MALSEAQKWANTFSLKVNPGSSFLDNFANDVSQTAKGFVPGMLEIGKTISNDVSAPFTGKSFRSDNLIGQGIGAFKEQSFLPSLATGNFGEAWNRFHARPFSGLLDASLVAPAFKYGNLAALKLGPDSLKAGAAQNLGYMPLAAEHAVPFENAVQGLSQGSPSAFGQMPATLNFDGFGGVAAREVLNRPDYLKIGDQHFLRRTQRSVVPGAKDPVSGDGSLAPQFRNTNLYPSGTFADDSNSLLTVPRAENELMAKAGDAFYNKLEQIPEDSPFAFLTGSRRMARKMSRKLINRHRVSGDTARAAHGRVMAMIDEAFPDMDPVDKDRMLSDYLMFDRAGITPDSAESILERFRVPDEHIRVDPNAILDLTPDELLEQHGHAYLPHDPDNGLDDVFTASDPGWSIGALKDSIDNFDGKYRLTKLTPAQLQMRLEERTARKNLRSMFDKSFGDDPTHHGLADWTYTDPGGNKIFVNDLDPEERARRLNEMIEAKDLRVDRRASENRESIFDVEGESIPWVRDDVLARSRENMVGVSKEAHLRDIQDPLVQALYEVWKSTKDKLPAESKRKTKLTRAHNFINNALGHLARGEDPDLTSMLSRTYRDKIDFSERAQHEGVALNFAQAQVKDAIKGMSGGQYVKDLVDRARARDTSWDTMPDANRQELIRSIIDEDNRTKHKRLLEFYKEWKDARHFADTMDREHIVNGVPGVVQRIAAATNNPHLIENWDNPVLRQLAETIDAMVDQQGSAAREWMGGNRLDDSRIELNQNRLARWITGKDDAQGKFMSMRFPVKEGVPGYEVAKEMRELRDVASKDKGDPFSIAMRGAFDSSPEGFLRSFLIEDDRRWQQRLVDQVADTGLTLNAEQFSDYSKRGLIVGENDARKGKGRPYVHINPEGPMMKEIRALSSYVQHLADDMDARGLDSSGLREAISELEVVDQTVPTHDLSFDQAAKDPARPGFASKHPGYRVIPTPMYQALRREMADSGQALKFLKKTGDYWKPLVLHGRFPAWFRNNKIGAEIMLALSGGVRRYGEAYGKSAHWSSPENHDFLEEHFPEASELGSTHIARSIAHTSFEGKRGDKLFNLLNRLSDFNQKWADSPARLARTQQIMDDYVAQFQHMARENGLELEDTPELRLQMVQDERIRDNIAQEMLRDMIDFSDLGRVERDAVISLIPFYAFIKGSAKAGTRLMADHPERVWAADQVADVGTRESIHDAGAAAPDFARSWWAPGGGRGMVLATGAMNPYESFLDMINMGAGLVPGGMSYRQFGTENLLSSLNPILSGGIEAFTGKDLYFGTPLPNDNPMDTFLQSQTSIPLVAFLQKLALNQQGPTSTSWTSRPLTLANYGGLPVLDPRWGQVWARGLDEAQERYKNPAVIGMLNPPSRGLS